MEGIGMDDLGRNMKIEKSIKKAKRKVYTRMIGVTLLICLILYTTVTMLRLAIIDYRSTSYARMLGNLTVFTSPLAYGGYGTNLSAYNPQITVYGYQYAGFSYVDTHWDMEVDIAPVTLKMRYYDKVGSMFAYGKTKDEVSCDTAISILKNNPNSIASVSLTLDKVYNMKELKQIEKSHDVKIIWLALETGNEYDLPKNVRMDNEGAVRMFGIPTTFTKLDELKTYSIDFSKTEDYIALIEDEFEWSLKHRNYIAKDESLLGFDDMKEVIKNGMNVYGIVVVGPTEELIKLCKDEKFIYAWISNVYPWDWKE